jgi:hypothetical protein
MHAALGRCLSALLNCHGSFLQQIPQILKRLLRARARVLLHPARHRISPDGFYRGKKVIESRDKTDSE